MVRELQPRKFGVAQRKVESTVVFYAGQIKTKGGSNCSLPLPLGEIENGIRNAQKKGQMQWIQVSP